MDFPTDIDAVIVGTAMVETLIASSLSIVGTSVLLIDRNMHYGGPLSSLPYPAIADYVKSSQIHNESKQNTPSFIYQSASLHDIVDFEEKWFIDEREIGQTQVSLEQSEDSSAWTLESELVINAAAMSSLASNEVHSIVSNQTETILTEHTQVDESTSITSESYQDPSRDSIKRLIPISRTNILQRLRRTEFDLIPKMLLCESPTMDATLRSEIARYITFRFINSLLAYFPIPPHSENDHNQHIAHGLLEIPLCRKDIFLSKILSLRQKRTLGSFLEWCLTLEYEKDEMYLDFKKKPLSSLLAEKFSQDEFTQQILIHSIIISPMNVCVEKGVAKMKSLLLSMNKFGPFPFLLPMYGSADFPMAYSRLASVFGAITCLGCGFEEISSNDSISENQRRYKIKLSNGQTVMTDHIVMGVDYVHRYLKDPYIKTWMARASFIVVGSLSYNKYASDKIPLLPFPHLKYRGLNHDIVPFIIQTPVEPTMHDKSELTICHVCAAATERLRSLPDCFEPITKALFSEAFGTGDSKKPRLLYAIYYQFPIFAEIPSDLYHNKESTIFDNVFIAPGPDENLTLDSSLPHAEKIFRAICADKHPIKNDSKEKNLENQFSNLFDYWDGKFPPKPPKPEQIQEDNLTLLQNDFEVTTTNPTSNEHADQLEIIDEQDQQENI